MRKRFSCLIALALFCLVEKITAGIRCYKEKMKVITISCSPPYPKKAEAAMDEIERLFPVGRIRPEDVVIL